MRTFMLMLLTVFSGAGIASSVQNTTITEIRTGIGYGTYVLIKVANPPATACNTRGYGHYLIDTSFSGGEVLFSAVLAASKTKSTVDIYGEDSCYSFNKSPTTLERLIEIVVKE